MFNLGMPELLIIIVIVTLRMMFGLLTARIMKKKIRSAGAGWALGLLLGIIGLIIAALLPSKDNDIQNSD